MIVTAQQLIDLTVLILRKLPLASKFREFSGWLEFTYADVEYRAEYRDGAVCCIADGERWKQERDRQYSKWMTGVLNGLVRDNDGNMVAA